MVTHKIYFPLFREEYLKTCGGNPARIYASKNATGNAIGGLSVGEPDDELYAMTAFVVKIFRKKNPGT